ESEAQQLSEEIMLGAVVYGHEQMKAVIDAIHALVEEGGKPEVEWAPAPKNETLIAQVAQLAEAKVRDAYQTREKSARQQKLKSLSGEVMAGLAAQGIEADAAEVGNILFDMEA
ncbi:MAG: polyribonucleotide nucleotidyltransferase, partial [Massilia sp.]